MLVDTGPMVALLDANDTDHQRARQAAQAMPVQGWLTTLPCDTEAMYLLGRLEGLAGQEKLWRQIENGLVAIHQLDATCVMRMRVLITRYGDSPIDFADASLVALAERIDDREVFTFDQHFPTYWIHDRIPFEVIP